MTTALFSACVWAQTVPMVHDDLAGTSSNTSESILTSQNVTAGKFGLLGTLPCGSSEYIFAQPLYIPSVTISAVARNLVIVATLGNSVCAFDADHLTQVWSVNFGAGNTTYPGFSSGSQFFYGQAVGTVSTPAVDVAGGKIYVCSWDATGAWKIRSLDITTGSTLSTTTVTGQVIGTGDPTGGDTTSGANLLFFPAKQLQRPGLKLNSGKLYVTFGGVGDNHPWHGWIMAYNTSDMSQAGIFCASPNGFGGAIWGGEPTIDASGNVYVTTGNGTDQDAASGAYTNSVLKLSSTLSLLGSWTPSNAATINAADADTSANRVIILPGTNTLAATGAKDFNVYLLDGGCMSGGSGTACQTQTFKTNAAGTVTAFSGSYGAAFINNQMFLPTTAGSIYGFTWGGSTFSTTPFATNITSYGSFGPSAMSATPGILWVTTTASGQSSFTATHAGTLRARKTSDLTEIWNSDQAVGDTLGLLSKFAAPTIAAGKVFVATQSGYVAVYGLFPTGSTLSGGASLSGGAVIQ